MTAQVGGRAIAALTACLTVVTAVVVAGCTSNVARPQPASPDSTTTAPPQALTSMPDLRGQPLQQAGEMLVRAGMNVTVVIPAHTVTADQEYRRTQGHTSTPRPLTLPEVRVRFGSEKGWSQAVASHEPTVGAPLRAGDSVVLTAGRHSGGDPSRPWVWEHPLVIKKGGTTSCFECHEPDDCSKKCHVPMLEESGPAG